MQLGGNPIKVELLDDLTNYNPKFKKGAVGYTIPELKCSFWGSSDLFVAVEIDNSRLDLLWKGLKKL